MLFNTRMIGYETLVDAVVVVDVVVFSIFVHFFENIYFLSDMVQTNHCDIEIE